MPVDKLDGLVDAPLFEQISNRSREERNCAIGRSGDVTMPTSPAGATPLRFPALCPPPVDPGGGRPSASDAFEAVSDGRRERSATGWSIGRGARSLKQTSPVKRPAKVEVAIATPIAPSHPAGVGTSQPGGHIQPARRRGPMR